MAETYFPGSSQPVTPPGEQRDPLAGVRGKMYPIGGVDVELFGISDVARVLNRKPGTIRKWENDKVIPAATFVKPGVNGDPRGRRRLYTRAQVEVLVEVAESEKILHDLTKRISTTAFSERVWSGFRQLSASL